MKNITIFILAILLNQASVFGQITIKQPEKGQVSNRAYYKKVSEDFNYLLLGSNSPQQGISATINEDQSNIKISGSFTSEIGVMSIEADLSASSGIYFFDEESGSEKGKITFNYFKRFKANSPYYKVDDLTRTKMKLQIIELITKSKSDYQNLQNYLGSKLYLDKLKEDCIKKNKECVEPNKEVENKLKEYVRKYILEKKYTEVKATDDKIKKEAEELYKKLGSRKFDDKSYKLQQPDLFHEDGIKIGQNNEELLTVEKEDENGKVKVNELLGKALGDYIEKRVFILEKLEDSINQIELKNVERKWAATQIWFLGISPFYERQTVNRFTYDGSKEFDDMFEAERGNVYGLTLSASWNQRKEIGSTNWKKPYNWFMRGGIALSRASNISSFTQSTFRVSTPVGNDATGNPVDFSNTKEAFIGDTNFGFGTSYSIFYETYFNPIEAFGLFGKIGYEKINFKESLGIDDKELIPLRLGVFFNLKNKEKDKPLVTVQVFLDRSNLRLAPSEPDNNLKFGFGVGLPINIRPGKD